MKSTSELAADFDAIAAALAESPQRDNLTPAELALLRHLPSRATTAIDVGCGDGVVSRALARRGWRVVAVDLSPRMIELARSRTPSDLPVEYRVADVMRETFSERFDVVVSVAMAHHVPLDQIIPQLVRLVAPGGILLLQDVMNRQGLTQLPANVAAMIMRFARQLVGRSRNSTHVAAAYRGHGAGEEYLDASAVSSTFKSLLPGALVRLHLDWRYSVVWRVPVRDSTPPTIRVCR